MRSDNGPEFVSSASIKWIVSEKIESVLMDPGKP
jgi:putative transposase